MPNTDRKGMPDLMMRIKKDYLLNYNKFDIKGLITEFKP